MSNFQIKKEKMIAKDSNGIEKEIDYLAIKIRIKTNKGETDIKLKVNDRDKSLLNFLLSETKVDNDGVYQLEK